jgi:hypothetical protein
VAQEWRELAVGAPCKSLIGICQSYLATHPLAQVQVLVLVEVESAVVAMEVGLKAVAMRWRGPLGCR